MEIIEKYLSEEELGPISFLIGKTVYQIYSEALETFVDSHFYLSASFSFLLSKDSFFCFETEWIEIDAFDYYKLEFSIQNNPVGIKRTQEGYLVNPSCILLGKASKIKTIELFTDSFEAEGDFATNGTEREKITVKYDSCFVFNLDDGTSILIGIVESIANLTEFVRNKDTILKRIDGYEKRVEWK